MEINWKEAISKIVTKLVVIFGTLGAILAFYMFFSGNSSIYDVLNIPHGTKKQINELNAEMNELNALLTTPKFNRILINNTDKYIDYEFIDNENKSTKFSLGPYKQKIHENNDGDFYLRFEGSDKKLLNKISYEFYWDEEHKKINLK